MKDRQEAVRSIMARLAFILVWLAATIAVTGCTEMQSTPTASAGKVRQATACPQCKMVAVTVPQPIGPTFAYGRPFVGWGSGYTWGGLGNGFGWGGPPFAYTVYEDKCPGCQGALKTFFKEGKWQHKCSACTQKPFTCPAIHQNST